MECVSGILVSKWRCLKTELQIELEHVDKVVITTCLFHNILIDKEGLNESALQTINTLNAAEDLVRSTIRGSKRYNRAAQEAYDIRDQFRIYFNGEGAVGFQYNEIDTYV